MYLFLWGVYFIATCLVASSMGLSTSKRNYSEMFKETQVLMKSPEKVNKKPIDFLFTVVAPSQTQVNENYTAVISLEDSVSHVKFNISAIQPGTEFYSQKIVILQPELTKLITFNLQNTSLSMRDQITNKPAEKLKLFVFATSATNETYQEMYSLARKPINLKKIFVTTDKEKYSVGDTIYFRIIVFDLQSRTPYESVGDLKVYLTKSSEDYIPLEVNSIKVHNYSSGLVYTGSALAVEDVRGIVVKIPKDNLTESASLKITEPRSELFEVRLKSADIFLQEDSKVRITLSFLTREDSLPVDGKCTVESKEADSYYPEGNEIFKQRVQVRINRSITELEFDFSNQTKIFEGEKSVTILTTATCTHSSSKLQTEAEIQTFIFLKGLYRFKMVKAIILPKKEDNTTVIMLDIKVERKGGSPLLIDDLAQTVDVTVKLFKGVSESENKNKIHKFYFNGIPWYKVLKIQLDIQNVTSIANIMKTVSIKVESGVSRRIFRFKKGNLRWNKLPDLKISSLNKYLSGGSTAQFLVTSSDTSLDELKLNAILYSSDEIISNSRQTVKMYGNEGGVLEIEIPRKISKPKVLYLEVFGKYPYGCTDEDFFRKLKISSCVLKASTLFDVNIPKPTLRTINLIKTNKNTNELLLEIYGGSKNIKHVSLELAAISNNELRNSDFENSFVNELMEQENKVSLYSNGFIKKRLPTDVENNLSAMSFEFSEFQANNGSASIALSLNSNLYSGAYMLKALVFSKDEGGLTYTNKVEVDIPHPTIKLHIPFVPIQMVAEETIQLTVWVKNNSPENIKEEIYYEIINEDLELSTKLNSTSMVVPPESYETFQVFIAPDSAGQYKLNIWSKHAPNFSKIINVVPEGKRMQFSQSKLIEKQKEALSENITSIIPDGCVFSSGKGVITKNYSTDIFGDLYDAIISISKLVTTDDTYSYLSWFSIIMSLVANSPERGYDNIFSYAIQLLENSGVNDNLNEVLHKSEVSLFHVENYVYAIRKLNTLQDENFTKFNVSDILGIQTEKGSFVAFVEKVKEIDSSSEEYFTEDEGSGQSLEEVFVETIFGLLALNYEGMEKPNKTNSLDMQTKLGLKFLQTTLDEFVKDNAVDNYPLSLLAYLYSQLKHRDISKIWKDLKQKSTSNSQGIFWTSYWKESKSFPKESKPRDFSIAATAYALMAHVNLEHADSVKIAQWLVAQRNNDGMYDSLSDTSLVMRSLLHFWQRRNSSYDLIRNSAECYLPFENSTKNSGLTLEKSLDTSKGIIKMQLCSNISDRQEVSISLPSRFVFNYEEIYSSYNFYDIESSTRNFRILEGGGRLSFPLASLINYAQEKCVKLNAYNLFRTKFKSLNEKSLKSPLVVTMHSKENSEESSSMYYFL